MNVSHDVMVENFQAELAFKCLELQWGPGKSLGQLLIDMLPDGLGVEGTVKAVRDAADYVERFFELPE
jgi:hypothetical protein